MLDWEATGARRVTTAEIERFEECRLAWWYDREHPLAKAGAGELSRRLDLFEAVYGPGVRDLPEFHLMNHLRDRASGAPPPTNATVISDEAIGPLDKPTVLVQVIFLIGAVIVGLVFAGIAFTIWHP